MKKHLSLFLGLSALSASALDLSPNFIITTADGITIRKPYFADGSKKYAVTLNVDTELVPYEDGALFRFIKLEHAAMRLRPSSFSVEVKFEPETLVRYEEAARRLLPQIAEDVVLDEQNANPITINRWTSHRFIYKYKTPSGEMQESITFLNITPSQQVIMQVYSPEKDFADAAARAWDVIRRWHELDPSTVPHGS